MADAPIAPDMSLDAAEENGPALERMVPEVINIPRFPLASELLFNKNGSINLKNLKAHFLKEGRLQKRDIFKIVESASNLFAEEPNLIRLRDPISVCGDIHGQFYDLIRLMHTAGKPKNTKYLFLGDYVDRGQFSTEVIFYLFAHKITYHRTFFMIRGNHECRHITKFFNFKEECIYKYDLEVYDSIMKAFDNLPIAATINHKFFCVHGGLSPDISVLKDILDIDRKREIPREGPFCDLLWADPLSDEPKPGKAKSVSPTSWFSYNESRQCSYVFGRDAASQFLSKNKLMAIIRGHEAQEDGYKFNMSKGQIPMVVTIFSAPNYCDVYKNKGACLQFIKDQLKIRQFGSSPHPYYLPNFMDVFTWSLPFMSEKVIDMVYQMMAYGNDQEILDEDVHTEASMLAKNDDQKIAEKDGINDLMAKLNALARFRKLARTRKNQNDKIVKLKSLSPNQNLPSGLLFKGSNAIDAALNTFQDVQMNDLAMEAMPTEEMKPGVPGKINGQLSGKSFTFRDMDLNEMKDLIIDANYEKERSFSLTIEDTEKEFGFFT